LYFRSRHQLNIPASAGIVAELHLCLQEAVSQDWQKPAKLPKHSIGFYTDGNRSVFQPIGIHGKPACTIALLILNSITLNQTIIESEPATDAFTATHIDFRPRGKLRRRPGQSNSTDDGAMGKAREDQGDTSMAAGKWPQSRFPCPRCRSTNPVERGA
jgi:hypothetical protein